MPASASRPVSPTGSLTNSRRSRSVASSQTSGQQRPLAFSTNSISGELGTFASPRRRLNNDNTRLQESSLSHTLPSLNYLVEFERERQRLERSENRLPNTDMTNRAMVRIQRRRRSDGRQTFTAFPTTSSSGNSSLRFLSSINSSSRSALEATSSLARSAVDSASTSRGAAVRRRLRQAQAARRVQTAQRRGLETSRNIASLPEVFDMWSVPVDDVNMNDPENNNNNDEDYSYLITQRNQVNHDDVNVEVDEEDEDNNEMQPIDFLAEDENENLHDEGSDAPVQFDPVEYEIEVSVAAQTSTPNETSIHGSVHQAETSSSADPLLTQILTAGPLNDDDANDASLLSALARDASAWITNDRHSSLLDIERPISSPLVPADSSRDLIINQISTIPLPQQPLKKSKCSRQSFVLESSMLCPGRVLYGTQRLAHTHPTGNDSSSRSSAFSLVRARDGIQRQFAVRGGRNISPVLALQQRTRRAIDELTGESRLYHANALMELIQNRTNNNNNNNRSNGNTNVVHFSTEPPTRQVRVMASDEQWDVKVTLQTVDYDTGKVAGLMEALNVRNSSSTVITYFEGEIIDFVNHTLWTDKWRADRQVDLKYWLKLEAFKDMDERAIVKGLRNPKWLAYLNHRYILMRWKERFFVNVKEDDSGLTIAGFYYVSMRRSDGTMEGFYHDPESSPYQRLSLNVQGPGVAFSEWYIN